MRTERWSSDTGIACQRSSHLHLNAEKCERRSLPRGAPLTARFAEPTAISLRCAAEAYFTG
jgi:hypothetical protein